MTAAASTFGPAMTLAELGQGPLTIAGRIALLATDAASPQLADLKARYGSVEPENATIVVALGGDGFMLETQHRLLGRNTPVYGMNCGSVGFLMNEYREEGLLERLAAAQAAILHPLRMCATGADGKKQEALAINDVYLLRESRQAAKLRITIDGKVRLEELICDGILVSTPAGSTAYNLSAHGPIVPLGANLLPLTPISAFRPRRWRGALLPAEARVVFEVLEGDKRPVAVAADYTEVRDIRRVEVWEDREVALTMLFDPDHGLSERIIAEQFTV